jgi:hypothetical protein
MNGLVSSMSLSRHAVLLTFLCLAIGCQLGQTRAQSVDRHSLQDGQSSRESGPPTVSQQAAPPSRAASPPCAESTAPVPAERPAAGDTSSKGPAWTSMFDGKSLAGWKVPVFGGDGEVSVAEGRILFDFGEMLTGITYTKEFPASDYEIRLEAMRVDGIDFFCGLTFPVADSYCSLIVGGWAGAVVGLSSIDGRDASENETTKYMNFKTGKWYGIRLRVTRHRIRAWIDDQLVVDQQTDGRKISTRAEVDLSRPLGIAAWQTRAAVRKIEYRRLGSASK